MENEIKKYQNKEIYDYSCSETIIHAANDYYNLNLSEDAFKMMAPFSGGMYEQDLCGILSASISVLGIIFTKKTSHNSPILKEATIALRQAFLNEFGYNVCRKLSVKYHDIDEGCKTLMVRTGTILKNIIKTYQDKDNNKEEL